MTLYEAGMKRAATAFLSIGAGAIGLLEARGHISPELRDRLLPEDYILLYILIALIMVALGCGLLLIAWLQDRLGKVLSEKQYACRRARRADLHSIHSMALEHFGRDVSSVRTMRSWLRVSPDCMRVITKHNRYGDRIEQVFTGYYCLLPLSDEALVELLGGRLTGSSLSARHIASTRCKAIYLGAVAARGVRARGLALGWLLREVDDWARTRGAVQVYTRPVTKDGLRLARAYGFTPVTGQDLTLGCLAEAHIEDLLDPQ